MNIFSWIFRRCQTTTPVRSNDGRILIKRNERFQTKTKLNASRLNPSQVKSGDFHSPERYKHLPGGRELLLNRRRRNAGEGRVRLGVVLTEASLAAIETCKREVLVDLV